MILILGGTTEGRLSVEALDEAGSRFYYSTKSDQQQIESKNGIRITGGMDAEQMITFCIDHDIRLIIDAAHPFAEQLHANIGKAAQSLRLPVVRFERNFPPPAPTTIVCADYDEVISRLESQNIERVLALTGVNTIPKLQAFWKQHTTFVRILDREESFQKAVSCGFPTEHLLVYSTDTPIDEILQHYRPQAVITKESGESGGYSEKEEACRKAGIPLYIVRRPALPPNFIIVTGRYGLRRAVEQYVKDFYPLRSGFTTGSCATAASRAAMSALLGYDGLQYSDFHLPNGEKMSMPVDRIIKGIGWAEAWVTKDAGDDPDITHLQTICSKVSFSSTPGIHFLQGDGVGRVTLLGIGLPVGEPAINPVPRQMISHELSNLYSGGIDVTISVPKGCELAQKTFNPKLGIEGGISILGTLGIVRPFSAAAFVESIQREMEVAAALGCTTIVINSGAKSEKTVRTRYPDLPSQAFIHYGNFIGDTLSVASRLQIPSVGLGIMLGKAVKLAAGHLDTHSRKVVLDKHFLHQIANEAGCSTQAGKVIDRVTLARELAEQLSEHDAPLFFERLITTCYYHCRSVYPNGNLHLFLISDDNRIIIEKT